LGPLGEGPVPCGLPPTTSGSLHSGAFQALGDEGISPLGMPVAEGDPKTTGTGECGIYFTGTKRRASHQKHGYNILLAV